MERVPYVVAGEFTIYQVAEQKAPLLAMAADADEPELDLGGVTEFDAAGMQLVLVAEQLARDAGKSLRLVAASPAVAEAFRVAGLDDRLPREVSA